jgi:hypothetical protein
LFETFADAGDNKTASTFNHARPSAGFRVVFQAVLVIVQAHAKIMPVCA